MAIAAALSVLLATVLFAAAGCGGDHAPTEGPTAREAAQHAARRAEHRRLAQRRTRAVKRFMAGTKGTSWYPLLKHYEVQDSEVVVTTALYPDTGGEDAGKAICSVLLYSGLRFVRSVIVEGPGPSILATCAR